MSYQLPAGWVRSADNAALGPEERLSAVVSGPVAELDAHPGMMPAFGGLNRAVSEAMIGGLQAAICLMQDLPDRRRNAGIGPRREEGFGTT